MERVFGADRSTGNCSPKDQCGPRPSLLYINQYFGEDGFGHCSLAFCWALSLFAVDVRLSHCGQYNSKMREKGKNLHSMLAVHEIGHDVGEQGLLLCSAQGLGGGAYGMSLIAGALD